MSDTNEKKHNSTLHNIGSTLYTIGLLLVLVVAGVVGKHILWPLTAHYLGMSESGPALTLADVPEMCDEVNKGLPTVVNEFFTWDRLVPNESGATMQIHLSKHTLQDVQVDAFREEMKGLVSKNLQSNPTMKRIFDSGLSVKCEYTDKNGAFVCSFTISGSHSAD